MSSFNLTYTSLPTSNSATIAHLYITTADKVSIWFWNAASQWSTVGIQEKRLLSKRGGKEHLKSTTMQCNCWWSQKHWSLSSYNSEKYVGVLFSDCQKITNEEQFKAWKLAHIVYHSPTCQLVKVKQGVSVVCPPFLVEAQTVSSFPLR